MSEFDSLVRGSVIMRWSPSGALSRFVVLRGGPEHGYHVGTLNDDNSMSIGAQVHDGFAIVTREGIDEDEGFGYTYTFMPDKAWPLPKDYP